MAPRQLRIGDALRLQVTLHSTAAGAQPLLIDCAVHHVKANGVASPKVFKGWSLTLAPGATLQLEKDHSMRAVTTRRCHPGRHEVDLRINGRVVARDGFDLAG